MGLNIFSGLRTCNAPWKLAHSSLSWSSVKEIFPKEHIQGVLGCQKKQNNILSYSNCPKTQDSRFQGYTFITVLEITLSTPVRVETHAQNRLSQASHLISVPWSEVSGLRLPWILLWEGISDSMCLKGMSVKFLRFTTNARLGLRKDTLLWNPNFL